MYNYSLELLQIPPQFEKKKKKKGKKKREREKRRGKKGSLISTKRIS